MRWCGTQLRSQLHGWTWVWSCPLASPWYRNAGLSQFNDWPWIGAGQWDARDRILEDLPSGHCPAQVWGVVSCGHRGAGQRQDASAADVVLWTTLILLPVWPQSATYRSRHISWLFKLVWNRLGVTWSCRDSCWCTVFPHFAAEEIRVKEESTLLSNFRVQKDPRQILLKCGFWLSRSGVGPGGPACLASSWWCGCY